MPGGAKTGFFFSRDFWPAPQEECLVYPVGRDARAFQLSLGMRAWRRGWWGRMCGQATTWGGRLRGVLYDRRGDIRCELEGEWYGPPGACGWQQARCDLGPEGRVFGVYKSCARKGG